MRRVYLAGPITGLTQDASNAWRYAFEGMIGKAMVKTIWPMSAEAHLLPKEKLGFGYKHPLFTDRMILLKDAWYVEQSDAVVANFLGSEQKSTGTIIECALAWYLKKPLILVMEPGNCHNHGMLNEMAWAIVPTLEAGAEVLIGLAEAVCDRGY